MNQLRTVLVFCEDHRRLNAIIYMLEHNRYTSLILVPRSYYKEYLNEYKDYKYIRFYIPVDKTPTEISRAWSLVYSELEDTFPSRILIVGKSNQNLLGKNCRYINETKNSIFGNLYNIVRKEKLPRNIEILYLQECIDLEDDYTQLKSINYKMPYCIRTCNQAAMRLVLFNHKISNNDLFMGIIKASNLDRLFIGGADNDRKSIYTNIKHNR